MRKQILLDEEIESIFKLDRELMKREERISVVDLYHEFTESLGLYEAEKSLLSMMDESIVMSEIEEKRGSLISSASMVSGDVECNPEDLICPECGCRYVAFYEHVCYLRKGPVNHTEVKHRLTALSSEFGRNYYGCLGCGYKFEIEE